MHPFPNTLMGYTKKLSPLASKSQNPIRKILSPVNYSRFFRNKESRNKLMPKKLKLLNSETAGVGAEKFKDVIASGLKPD